MLSRSRLVAVRDGAVANDKVTLGALVEDQPAQDTRDGEAVQAPTEPRGYVDDDARLAQLLDVGHVRLVEDDTRRCGSAASRSPAASIASVTRPGPPRTGSGCQG